MIIDWTIMCAIFIVHNFFPLAYFTELNLFVLTYETKTY